MARAGIGGRVWRRLRAALPDAAAATVAGALAWQLSRTLLGHPHPVFAAVTGILCLAPGLPNHGRQAWGLILGVTTGIVVGEVAFLMPDTIPVLRLNLATFLAMMIATAYGQPAVVSIQAGVSTLLVLAMGPEYAGLTRLLDVFCGTAVGLLFSQVLFTPDPVKQLRAGERALLTAMGAAFAQAGEALAARDQAKAQAALRAFSDAHGHVVALAGGIDSARADASWTLRGRLVRRDVRQVAERFGRRSTRAYAASLLFGTALASAIRREAAPAPESLAPGIAMARRLCDLDQPMAEQANPALGGLHDDWRRCLARLAEAMEAIRDLRMAELPDR